MLRLRYRFTAKDQDRIEEWRDLADRYVLWASYAAVWIAITSGLLWYGFKPRYVLMGACWGFLFTVLHKPKGSGRDDERVDVELDLDDKGLEFRCGDLTVAKPWSGVKWALLTPDGTLLRLERGSLPGIYVTRLTEKDRLAFETLVRRSVGRVREAP